MVFTMKQIIINLNKNLISNKLIYKHIINQKRKEKKKKRIGLKVHCLSTMKTWPKQTLTEQ